MNQELAVANRINNWRDRSVAGVMADRLNALANGMTQMQLLLRDIPEAAPFGWAVLKAATATGTKYSLGACRWDAAISLCQKHNVKLPEYSEANRALLGDGCKRCLPKLKAQIKKKFDESAQEYEASKKQSAVVASAAVRNTHLTMWHGAMCFDCMNARRKFGLTEALVASLTPHAMRTKPKFAGEGSRVIHNGRGRNKNCECNECRGSRIIAFNESQS